MSENSVANNVEIETIDQIIERLVAAIESESISCYGIATILNATFEIAQSSKRVRPQMMYNYDRNGLIAKNKKSVKSYSKSETIAFAKKYANKHA